MLVVGKLTHAAGFAVLTAAGAARMPFGRFLAINFAATIPKSLFFLALGLFFGAAHSRIATWLSTGSSILLGIAVAALGVIVLWRCLKRRKTADA